MRAAPGPTAAAVALEARAPLPRQAPLRAAPGATVHADASLLHHELRCISVRGIPGVFDAQLQNIIFGDRGLLRQQLEGFGIWEAAVRVACRFQSLHSGSFVRDIS